MIGVIVEGMGELEPIASYLSRVNTSRRIATRPLYADLQPKANPCVIATSAKAAIKQLTRRGVTKIIVLIDLEDRDCPIKFAEELKLAFQRAYSELTIVPVVKHSAIENWMIADIDALKAMPKRFGNIDSVESQLARYRCVDKFRNPIRLLNQIAIKTEYHKTQDPPRIAPKQNIETMLTKSRSFRKFLAEVEHKIATSPKEST